MQEIELMKIVECLVSDKEFFFQTCFIVLVMIVWYSFLKNEFTKDYLKECWICVIIVTLLNVGIFSMGLIVFVKTLLLTIAKY